MFSHRYSSPPSAESSFSVMCLVRCQLWANMFLTFKTLDSWKQELAFHMWGFLNTATHEWDTTEADSRCILEPVGSNSAVLLLIFDVSLSASAAQQISFYKWNWCKNLCFEMVTHFCRTHKHTKILKIWICCPDFRFPFWQRAFSPEGLSEMWNEMVKDEEITFSGEESAHPGMALFLLMYTSVRYIYESGTGKVKARISCDDFRGLHWLLWNPEEGWTKWQREERGGGDVGICTSLHHRDLGLGASARWDGDPGGQDVSVCKISCCPFCFQVG